MNKVKRDLLKTLKIVEKTCTEALKPLKIRYDEKRAVGMLIEKGWGELDVMWDNDKEKFFFIGTSIEGSYVNYLIDNFITRLSQVEKYRKDSDYLFMDNILEICIAIKEITNHMKL